MRETGDRRECLPYLLSPRVPTSWESDLIRFDLTAVQAGTFLIHSCVL